ncbi:hypothetical protein QZH41_001200 [Actinostola sp. cb2023]|nr:hypothetical protein QZH41_001200 [Actinostola sp. cb2023]
MKKRSIGMIDLESASDKIVVENGVRSGTHEIRENYNISHLKAILQPLITSMKCFGLAYGDVFDAPDVNMNAVAPENAANDREVQKKRATSMAFFVYIPVTCINLNLCITTWQTSSIIVRMSYIFWIVAMVAMLLICSIAGARVNNAASRLSEVLYDINIENFDSRNELELVLLISNLNSNYTGLTVGGLVTINKEMMITVIDDVFHANHRKETQSRVTREYSYRQFGPKIRFTVQISRVNDYISNGLGGNIVDPDGGINIEKKRLELGLDEEISPLTDEAFPIDGFRVGVSDLPKVGYAQIWKYLIEDVELKKQLSVEKPIVKGYNFYKSGKVKGVFSKSENGLFYVKSQVMPSYAKSSSLYAVKIIIKANSEIHRAYCPCPAGIDGRCNHLAASLFAIEDMFGQIDKEKENAYFRLREVSAYGRCLLTGCVRLRDVSAYGRCLLTGGVRLREVSAYGRYLLTGGVRLREVPAYGRCPLTGGVCLREVPAYGRCPLTGGVRLRDVSAYGMCPLTEGACLREVSAYGRCLLTGGVRLREVSAYGRCPLTGGVRLREVPAYGRCPLTGGACLREVPAYGRCPLTRGACLREVAAYGRWPLTGGVRLREVAAYGRCLLTGGVRLREVAAYGRCPLTGGVRLREVSININILIMAILI